MIDHILIHTITVSRRTKTGTNDLGEPTYSYSDVYTGIKARVETYSPEVEYKETGQRPILETIVYVQPDKDLQSEDIITFNGSVIGRVTNEVNALTNTSNLHHREFKVEPN
jgi:hypothetical protein